MHFTFPILAIFLPSILANTAVDKHATTTTIKTDAQGRTIHKRIAEPTQFALLAEPSASGFQTVVRAPETMVIVIKIAPTAYAAGWKTKSTRTSTEIGGATPTLLPPNPTAVYPARVAGPSTLVRITTTQSWAESNDAHCALRPRPSMQEDKTPSANPLVLDTKSMMVKVLEILIFWQR